MGILSFFHKIKTWFARSRESSIPFVGGVKRYGNYGENEFMYILSQKLPSCKIKRSVVISTDEGNAEIDCLILYENKLFAIEVKHWKGSLKECSDGFLQEKIDKWTGETHAKILKSPFKQLSRAIYLLRKQFPAKAWVNSVVFFTGNELESVSTSSDNVWFDNYPDLVYHIQNEGKSSFGKGANDLFEKCIAADYLYYNTWGNSLQCVINRDTLRFYTSKGLIPTDEIVCIRIAHHWHFDKLYIRLSDGSEFVIALENAKIQVSENGNLNTYALCKLDYIELGRTILSAYKEF